MITMQHYSSNVSRDTLDQVIPILRDYGVDTTDGIAILIGLAELQGVLLATLHAAGMVSEEMLEPAVATVERYIHSTIADVLAAYQQADDEQAISPLCQRAGAFQIPRDYGDQVTLQRIADAACRALLDAKPSARKPGQPPEVTMYAVSFSFEDEDYTVLVSDIEGGSTTVMVNKQS